jgi:hypothetical protein
MSTKTTRKRIGSGEKRWNGEVRIVRFQSGQLNHRRRLEPLTARLKGPAPVPRSSNIGFAPIGDGANYGREFFTFLGQRVGEAWGVPLVKGRPN